MHNYSLHALVYVATQSISSNAEDRWHFEKNAKRNQFFLSDDNIKASLHDVRALVQAHITEDPARHRHEVTTVHLALRCIHQHVQTKLEIGFFQKIWGYIRGSEYRRHQREIQHVAQELHDMITTFLQRNCKDGVSIENESHARCHFSLRFKTLFGCHPKALIKKEAILVHTISNRIWNSANVQSQVGPEKYNTYERLMSEFYSGTHMLFEENDDESVLTELERQIGHGIEVRDSSHYGKVGAQKHRHIRGEHLPETLFFHGLFAKNEEAQKDECPIVPGKYAPAEHPRDLCFKAFWIQTERNPDGPDWTSWLKHRTLDFVQYFFLKVVFRRSRPQIANYIGPHGRGLPDHTPIIIRQLR